VCKAVEFEEISADLFLGRNHKTGFSRPEMFVALKNVILSEILVLI
jgi:hypothetical protein